jgi:glycerophosphoryl diester phosphodiesterase
VLIVAHRGAHEPESPGVRENTLVAFVGAARIGAQGVELDVRRTADGVLVVHHDAAVPGLGPIAGLEAAALPAWLPTLDAALAACTGLDLVDVEVKNSPFERGFDPGSDAGIGLAAEVAAVVAGSPVAGQAILTGFHLQTVDALKAAAPGLATGWLTLPGQDPLEAVGIVAAHGLQALAPPDAAVSAEVVAAAHAAGLQVIVWTVDQAERVAELAAWGVDGCVTNWPRLAASRTG